MQLPERDNEIGKSQEQKQKVLILKHTNKPSSQKPPHTLKLRKMVKIQNWIQSEICRRCASMIVNDQLKEFMKRIIQSCGIPECFRH